MLKSYKWLDWLEMSVKHLFSKSSAVLIADLVIAIIAHHRRIQVDWIGFDWVGFVGGVNFIEDL